MAQGRGRVLKAWRRVATLKYLFCGRQESQAEGRGENRSLKQNSLCDHKWRMSRMKRRTAETPTVWHHERDWKQTSHETQNDGESMSGCKAGMRLWKRLGERERNLTGGASWQRKPLLLLAHVKAQWRLRPDLAKKKAHAGRSRKQKQSRDISSLTILCITWLSVCNAISLYYTEDLCSKHLELELHTGSISTKSRGRERKLFCSLRNVISCSEGEILKQRRKSREALLKTTVSLDLYLKAENNYNSNARRLLWDLLDMNGAGHEGTWHGCFAYSMQSMAYMKSHRRREGG